VCSAKETDVAQAHLLAAAGAFFTIIGFIIYNVRDGRINSASWLLWVIGDALEAGTYFVMTGEDLLKNVVPIVFAIGSFLTFFIALIRMRFGYPDRVDQLIMSIDLTITAGWFGKIYSAAMANIMLVATELISFLPLYRGILRGEDKEYASPWVFWAIGDLFFLATVLSLTHRTEEMVYPIVQALAHLVVVVCIVVHAINHQQEARTP